jgi:UDP-glucose 4-epimerase
MKMVVTGGCGFIGSHIVDRLLEEGHEVTVIDNLSTGSIANIAHRDRDIRIIQADICDLDIILPYFKGKDMVFHIAALADIIPSIIDPRAYYNTNVSGTMAVLEAARLSGVKRFIYAASSSCYGIPLGRHYPTKETAPIKPRYPYAFTKYLGEETVFHWAKVYGLSAVSLRLFNVYGTRSRTSGAYGAVFGVFLAQKFNHKPYTIVGDGNQKRDFIYVTDVVDAFIKASFSALKDEIFNVGYGKPQSINRLVSLLGGRKVYIPKRPGEPDCTWADTGKIRSALKWRPKVSFEQGVKHVLKDIRYWRQAPLWTPEAIKKATKDWFRYLGKG